MLGPAKPARLSVFLWFSDVLKRKKEMYKNSVGPSNLQTLFATKICFELLANYLNLIKYNFLIIKTMFSSDVKRQKTQSFYDVLLWFFFSSR